MLRISKNNHIHRMSAQNKPCATIQSGERIVLETWDALEGRSREYFDNKTPHSEVFPNANPATGPVYVEGAQPGDALEVEIHNIILQDEGYLTLSGDFISDGAGSEDVYAAVKVRNGMLHYNGMSLPAQPMIGVIGTASLEDMWCQETGDHGGNMDCSIIGVGSRVLLPVYVEGGLLSAGDVHAAMGDGEVLYQGVEIGADIEMTVRVIKKSGIIRPVVINSSVVACIASDKDINLACHKAITDMKRYLVCNEGIDSENAVFLTGLYGNLRFCQVANPQKTVRMEIPREYINLAKEAGCHERF